MGAVVGVDPSIASTGVFVIEGVDRIRFERVQSKPGADSLSNKIARMRLVVVRVHEFLISGEVVDLIVMEGPSYGSNNNQTHMLAGFWWLLVHALEKTAPVAVVQPGTLKKFATGDGGAGKDEMLAAAIGAFPGAGIRNNDVADAAALAGMGAVHLGREFGGGFAPSGRASAQVVRWPELRSK